VNRRRRAGSLLGAALLCVALSGCADELRDEANQQAESTAPTGTAPAVRTERADPTPPVEPARCPAEVPGCRTASGRIIYVEAVDPDGDGDAHFVLASREGISAPGVSIIDVERDLRPHPLPRVGDQVSAAGPVYPGSYGQHQIQAVVLHTEATAG
jgi:hypothetical protein